MHYDTRATFMDYDRSRNNLSGKLTGKPGKPDNAALSLEGIEFEVYYADMKGNEEPIDNPLTGEKVNAGEKMEGVILRTDENGCADTTGLNMQDATDKGVLTPGHTYILKESKTNDSYILNDREIAIQIPKDIPDKWRSDSGKPVCVFVMKSGGDASGNVIADKSITSAKELYTAYVAGKSNINVDTLLLYENSSPRIGVGVQKYDILLDSFDLGANGDATHGNATLEGHTFVVINGTKSEICLNDKRMPDGKGTKIQSIWEHGDHLKNPYNPTYEELYHYAEECNFTVDRDGNGYVCAVLTTNEEGYAETVKDLLPLGVYYIIEVDSKHDYLVNRLDVGHIGEYIPGGDGTEDQFVLTQGGTGVSASDIPKDGAVFTAEFTQEQKATEWQYENKTHADAKEHGEVVVRGGVQFQKYNWNSDDPYATGDSDLSGAHFAIINVSDEAVVNCDGTVIPTWKKHGYIGKSL